MFIAVLAGGSAVVAAAHLSLPPWLVPVVALLAPFGKPTVDSVGSALAKRMGRHPSHLPRVTDPIDPKLLGVHPAIPLPAGSDPRLHPELPTYVVRNIDSELPPATCTTSSVPSPRSSGSSCPARLIRC